MLLIFIPNFALPSTFLSLLMFSTLEAASNHSSTYSESQPFLRSQGFPIGEEWLQITEIKHKNALVRCCKMEFLFAGFEFNKFFLDQNLPLDCDSGLQNSHS